MSHFTTELSKTIDVLQNYALVDSLADPDEASQQSPYIQVHPFVLPVVRAMLREPEWESHLRRTVLTLFHTFMDVPPGSEREMEFFKCAGAIATKLETVLLTDRVNPAAYFKEELSDFWQHICGVYAGSVRAAMHDVFNEYAESCASGNLSHMREAVKHANDGRGRKEYYSGSYFAWWYSGTKRKAPETKHYLYD